MTLLQTGTLSAASQMVLASGLTFRNRFREPWNEGKGSIQDKEHGYGSFAHRSLYPGHRYERVFFLFFKENELPKKCVYNKQLSYKSWTRVTF